MAEMPPIRSRAFQLAALATLVVVAAAPAQSTRSSRAPRSLRLFELFGDGMVLQRAKPIVVWGWAHPGAQVTVIFRQDTARTRAHANGGWRTGLRGTGAGGPFTLVAQSESERIELRDVLVGDVWVASGQSNMELTVAQANNAATEIAGARDSLIRQFKVPQSFANAPDEHLAGGSWTRADSGHVGAFSAVGYFFARDLRKSVRVPIGLINTSWGGSSIEAWMSRASQQISDSAWGAMQEADARSMTAVRDTIRARIGGLPTIDSGLVNGRAVWADPALDDSAWIPVRVPGYWENEGLLGLDGVGWYRLPFELTESEARDARSLTFGAIDDDEITWINGVEVGRTPGYNAKRSYGLAPGTLHGGRNVLAVRVTDWGAGGGINGPVTLAFANGSQRSLAGPWRFKVGEVSFRPDGQRINKIPSVLYNKMLKPLQRFPVRGVIWYQGESNANNTEQAAAYRGQFKTLIQSWRSQWNGGGSARGLPFLWVQLPNFGPADSTPPLHPAWATQRESMDAALSIPGTGRAVTIDLGDPNDIHPRNKQDVGSRLARVARALVYREKIVASGPTYHAHTTRGDTVVVEFTNARDGLQTRPPTNPPGGFALAGADRKFVWANAKIVGGRVYVWSDRIRRPVALRYAWANNPDRANLYNREGLPVAPFRTDRW